MILCRRCQRVFTKLKESIKTKQMKERVAPCTAKWVRKVSISGIAYVHHGM